MTMWFAVLVGCLACFALKYAGYLVPERWIGQPRVTRVTTLLPVALLAALLVVQTASGPDGSLVADARVAALAAAIVLLLLRVNFVLVVIAAALVAAGLRALGWG